MQAHARACVCVLMCIYPGRILFISFGRVTILKSILKHNCEIELSVVFDYVYLAFI